MCGGFLGSIVNAVAPILGGLAGSAILPGIGTALGADIGGLGTIGGALGALGGGAATGASGRGLLLDAAGGALGPNLGDIGNAVSNAFPSTTGALSNLGSSITSGLGDVGKSISNIGVGWNPFSSSTGGLDMTGLDNANIDMQSASPTGASVMANYGVAPSSAASTGLSNATANANNGLFNFNLNGDQINGNSGLGLLSSGSNSLAGNAASSAAGGSSGGIMNNIINGITKNPLQALALASAVLQNGTAPKGTLTQAQILANQQAQQAQQKQQAQSFVNQLNSAKLNRTLTPPNISASDYYTYGSRPEMSFYNNLSTPITYTPTMKQGGLVHHYADGGYVKGGALSGGQADDVDAKLSNGEYVIPADVVSGLGDGFNDAGAKKLDGMLKAVRKHKTGNTKFPPAAKSVEKYLGGKYATGGKVAIEPSYYSKHMKFQVTGHI